ncbi:phosphoglycerate kinase [Mycoplasmopsis pullorum]|uniref:Phosphoglycerate kinase n=1 Tax=Mycoplasmopsis pullorum TaxID=48003 RepID=A0A1L4FRI9_9BACT|nr:phosphoglycerate kinase [Mycoplasmopsis pullorum]APJ38214.1 phosphoglycerate kinase [Mycoplasmopsis pullorum]TNK82665.1 phosphoglycerate kinase [Mycoplasmopsis pullorum]TNK84001.1 phosphoglycerate kinase [Mycoplasmopsis pullorum]TNK85183.1 phosphoglycerate kinase [Mycoplasmopsis pullorum]TNK85684.1 phosphoglycerate kinase [Mycoplasmopsis pullorum]
MKKTIDDLNLSGKKVLIRVDFNVPIKDGVITSTKRITAALPTIKKVISEGGKAILLSHLGRVKTEEDLAKRNIEPVAAELSKQLGKEVKFVNQTRGAELENAIAQMKDGDVLLMQNTRYEDLNDKAESKNNPELGKYWASLGDVFINDAFGTAHRAHASNVGIASNISESGLGYLMEKEVSALSKAINNPEHPYVAIIGGAKVSDKIQVLENLIKIADKMIIGGGMAYTFLKAQGHSIGNSLVENDYLELAKNFLEKYGDKVILPVDHLCAKEFADVKGEVQGIDIADGYMGLDLGPKSEEIFAKALEGAKTVVWNGPMGVTEFENFKEGTLSVCRAIAKLQNCYSVVGGGDSVAAVQKLGMEDKFSHVSTGGGASLELLQGLALPGVESIPNK